MDRASDQDPHTSSIDERMSEKEICPDHLLSGQEAAFARDIERLQDRIDEFVDEACPACSGDTARPAFEKHTFKYVRCRSCGTIYMRPRPSRRVIGDYYSNSENYRYWADHIFPASEDARRDKIHRPWLERVLGYCERHGVAKGTLLEVGPGFGTFASLAQESGAFDRVVAVEPTPQMAAACRERGVEVIQRPVEGLDGEVNDVDVIVAFEVIEHLFRPTDFVETCVRLLRKGGILVLSCPNGEGFDISVLGPVSLAVDPEHVNLFNPSSMRLLLHEAGFEVLEISTPGRLDAEFVRTAVLDGDFDLSGRPFLQRVLIQEWDRLGWPFQQFLAEQGLSSHMWTVARYE